jgi:PIN domain nuclease of toxin-antitoxin system
MSYLLDACALLAFINKETGWNVVDGLLKQAGAGDVVLFMNAINFYEVYYKKMQQEGQQAADAVRDAVADSAISILDVFPAADVMAESARLKTSYKISLADSIALGTASVLGFTLVTADHHELDRVEQNETISFHWIRPSN